MSKQMIKDFEDYTREQKFGNGFSLWRKGHLTQSPTRIVDDYRTTRNLVRSAFEAPEDYFEKCGCFTKQEC